MSSDYQELSRQAREAFARAATADQLERARVTWLGRKGRLAEALSAIPSLEPEHRRQAGRSLNSLKEELTALWEQQRSMLESPATGPETVDLTRPGRRPFIGRLHPITRIRREIEEIFLSLGFEIAEGPDVESEYYNFEALNIPAHHPARGMWDTLFTASPPGLVLRTHTSPVQIRVMETRPPPVRIIVPGRCYRDDTPDATHLPVFHQIEGLYVDRGVSMAQLRGVLDLFAHHLFGADLPTRFRPSYFPFTEPSAEMDIGCFLCRGKGCRLCKGTGWIEILGCGMVNPVLWRFVDYDDENLTGYAFGMGVERIAMLRYGVEDIRHYYENDLRFLEQC